MVPHRRRRPTQDTVHPMDEYRLIRLEGVPRAACECNVERGWTPCLESGECHPSVAASLAGKRLLASITRSLARGHLVGVLALANGKRKSCAGWHMQ
eukprot:3392915-Amphidinium_carterae.1